MSPTRITALVLRQLYLMRESPARVLAMFAWVAVDIVLWGFITRYLNTVSTGLNAVPVMLGAVLLWDFLTRVMHGVTTAFFEDVWSRNFLNLFASPLSVGEYVTGLIVASILTSAIGLIVMVLLATAVFGLSFFAYGMAIIPFMFILFVTGIALGIVGSAVVLRFGPAAEWFVWPIPAMISPFACVFYPMSVLPHWMQIIAKSMPTSYVFESMRNIIGGNAAAGDMLASGMALSLVYLLLACLFFARIFRRAVRTGLLARYSAETVS